MKHLYLASPFFNERELTLVEKTEDLLRERGFTVYSPREHEYRGAEAGTPAWAEGIFREDVQAIDDCEAVVMLYHGNESDSGTAWECGYAYATGKPVVCVQLGKLSNLMVHASVRANITWEALRTYDFDELPAVIYQGPMT